MQGIPADRSYRYIKACWKVLPVDYIKTATLMKTSWWLGCWFKERKQVIFFKIRPIIAQELKIDEDKITPASKIAEDLGADSLDAIEIIMGLEEAFNIEILDEDADKMTTIDDIIIYLVDKI